MQPGKLLSLLRARQLSHAFASTATSVTEAAQSKASATPAVVEQFRHRLQQGSIFAPQGKALQAKLFTVQSCCLAIEVAVLCSSACVVLRALGAS